MQLIATYMTFYLDGRGDDALDDEDMDLDVLVTKAATGPDDPRTIAVSASEQLAAPLRLDREKREWIRDNKKMIKEAGGDADLAYEHYLKGRIDQYAHELENEIVTALFEDDEPDEDDDDDEDDDGEDEDDDDDDGGDDADDADEDDDNDKEPLQ